MPLRMGVGEGPQGYSGVTTSGRAARGKQRGTTPQRWETHRPCTHVAAAITRDAVDLGHPVAHCLASTGSRDGGWVCSTFQMAEDLADHLALCDDGDEPQCPALTQRAVRHIQRKDPMQQTRPAPARRPGVRLRVHPLLAWRRDDAPTEVAVRREAAPITQEMHVRQGHERGQLLQEFQRREANPRGAIGPWMGEGIDEIAVGVFLEALQRHGAAGGIADELVQLIASVRWNRRVGVERKSIDTGTARTSEPRRLALRAKTRADAAHVLAGSFATRDALL